MSMQAHLASLNEQLSLRAALAHAGGNTAAGRAIYARLAELTSVRVDAAAYDSEVIRAVDPTTTDDYRAGAEYARTRQPKEATMPPKAINPKAQLRAHVRDINRAEREHRNAPQLQYLRPFDGKDGMSAPSEVARFDAAVEALARRSSGPADPDRARLEMHVRAQLAGVMPMGEDGEPCMPRNPEEQRRFDSKVAELQEQQARRRFAANQTRRTAASGGAVRTDAADECKQCGDKLDPDATGELCSVCAAKGRANRRASRAWMLPLDESSDQRARSIAEQDRQFGEDPNVA